MAAVDKCLKCGSTRVIEDARIVDENLDGTLKVQVQKNPQARVFKGTIGVPLKSRVCCLCGYVELYASDPAKLLQVHEGGQLSAPVRPGLRGALSHDSSPDSAAGLSLAADSDDEDHSAETPGPGDERDDDAGHS